MKIITFILILWVAILPNVRAQVAAVTVNVSLDQEQFLSNEELRVAVRITNRSGQTLKFGKENDWLTFTVEARDQYVVSQLSDVPVAGEFSLESSESGTKRVNITPHFDFRQSGRYQITATVKIPQWGKDIASRPVVFDIVTPTKLKEFDFGVPTTATNAAPEMRKYILQQAIYLKQMRLYLRVTDSTGTTVFRVFPIAPMISFSKPEAQVDKESNLHVLHQTYSHSFNYSVINPDGNVIQQRTYDYTSTRPRLDTDSDGKIAVVGGALRMTANDLQKATAAQLPAQDAPSKKP
ncbi:MAG: hypothetical protein ABI042_19050 [Verrucomicrobiota bacterium]